MSNIHPTAIIDPSAEIDASAVPIHADAMKMRSDGHSALEHALHDGEDHELLLTMRGERSLPAVGNIPLMWIGTITAKHDILLVQNDVRTPLEPKGWEHTF